MPASLPRVLVVVVAHDGAPWLSETLAALNRQTYPHIDVIAVDNGSTDSSRDILIEELGEGAVLVAERDLGFPAAVSMALDAVPPDAPYVLFLHDDCALDEDAMARLVEALEADENVAIVGPKLVEWEDSRRLESVGLTIDLTGRMETGLDPDEWDQGQRDATREVLFVPTTAMLVRRSVYDELGRMDRRYHAFRDDLDLCWRAHLAGHGVEVVAEASARHFGGASNYVRMGQTAVIGPRYFAERNTLATLVKNYGPARLAVVLPLFALVGIAKVGGFLATRRVGDALQTMRAWAWNVLHARESWEHRRRVQATRVRSDAELAHLFSRIWPRLRAYGEAMGEWIAGDEVRLEPVIDESDTPETVTHRLVAFVRRNPVRVTATVLLTFAVLAGIPLLAAGSLRGGELATWPTDGGAFTANYWASWHDAGGVGTSEAPSPAMQILAVFDRMAFGSQWLAPRLMLLLLPALAWVLAMRAGRAVTERRAPRLLAATLYVLSPPAIAAVATGRLGALVVLMALPAFATAFAALMRSDNSVGSARAVAGAGLAAAVMIAFEPVTAIFVVAAIVAGAAATAIARRGRWRSVLVRILFVAPITFLLLFPWSLRLFGANSPVTGGLSPPGAEAEPLWRWLLLTPELAGFPGVLAGIGIGIAALLGILFGTQRRLVVVVWSSSAFVGGATAGWLLGRGGASAWAWPGVPLLLVAAAAGALLLVAAVGVGEQLARHDFGWRQLGSAATAAIVLVGIVASGVSMVRQDWSRYAVGSDPLPAFLVGDEERLGSFRVLTLIDRGSAIDWDVTGPSGDDMSTYGLAPPAGFITSVQTALEEVITGSDPGAAGRLALLSIRYVVAPEEDGTGRLSVLLDGQLDLEPSPTADGRLFRVATWLPKGSWVARADMNRLEARGEVPPGVRSRAFAEIGRGTWMGRAPEPGSIIIAEEAQSDWSVTPLDGDLAVTAAEPIAGLVHFTVDGNSAVLVEHEGRSQRRALLVVQLLALLLTVSMLVRPLRAVVDIEDSSGRRP
ncbi:MAG: glycosyltransferase family 2 protein [Nitriliruptorales bacterium]|nr:glycosyltransferase family 2 protein [Nitriliruptorales bacterium]